MGEVRLPPPYKGQNSQLPAIVTQSPFCEELTNFKNKGGILALRQGHELHCAVSASNINPKDLSSYNKASQELFMVANAGTALVWYNVTTGTPSAVLTLAASSADEVYTVYFNGVLFYFGDDSLAPGASGPQQYNGTAWGAAGYTYPGSFVPYGGDSYKNRIYLIKQGAAAYGYGPVDGITGAITEVSLETVISTKAVLRMIRPISTTQNLTADVVQAFVMSSGEVLVYGGSFPNAANWMLISRFKVSRPIYHNSYVDAKGDSFILTETEILSLRNLFASGYDAERVTGIGASDQPRWEQIVTSLIENSSATLLQSIKGVYDERNDRLIITLPAYVDRTGEIVVGKPFQYIYDFALGAWYEYVQDDPSLPTSQGACYHDNSVFIAAQNDGEAWVINLEGGSNFVDDDLDGSGTVAIDYGVTFAPLPVSKFGAGTIDGVEAIMKSGLYPQTNFKWKIDLGRVTTNPQPLPAQGVDIAKPMFNVGYSGATTAQLVISGSSVSSETGLELYGFNVWSSGGAPGSR